LVDASLKPTGGQQARGRKVRLGLFPIRDFPEPG
jgi:hypothetical protein